MTDYIFTAPNMYTAAARIYDALPQLVGEDWPSVQPQLDVHMASARAAKSVDEMAVFTYKINEVLEDHAAAHKRYIDELHVQATILLNISQNLKDMGYDEAFIRNYAPFALLGMEWEADPATIPKTEDEVRAKVKRDLSEASTLRLNRVTRNWKALLSLIGGLNLLALDAIDKPDSLVLSATITVIGVILTDKVDLNVKLTQQDASVLWGMAWACAHKSPRWANKAVILEKTNIEREKVGLPPLNDTQLQHSLAYLLELKSIAHVLGQDGTYELIENVEMRD